MRKSKVASARKMVASELTPNIVFLDWAVGKLTGNLLLLGPWFVILSVFWLMYCPCNSLSMQTTAELRDSQLPESQTSLATLTVLGTAPKKGMFLTAVWC